jgi:hypothetical protein
VALRVKGFTENETSREDVENGQKFGPDTRRMSSQSFLKYFFVWCCEPSLLEVFVILLVIQHDPHHISRFFARYGIPMPTFGFFAPSRQTVGSGGIPHLAKNERDTPNFLYATLDKSACAPFS